jgi:hypothetical protein
VRVIRDGAQTVKAIRVCENSRRSIVWNSSMMRWALRIAVLVAATVSGAGCGARELPALYDGDLIYHTSRSTQSVAIQQATKSRWSHMGIIFLRNGKPHVLEAAATVRYTPLAQWIARGVDGEFSIRRWRDARDGLSPTQSTALRQRAEAFLGKRYDLQFRWSDSKIYCSELAWKAYERALGVRVGEPVAMGTFDLSGADAKAKARERFGAALPARELVIAPSAMFDADSFYEVASR